MANPLDIFFRVKGDSSDAVRALDDVGTAARRTESQAEKTQRSIQRMLQGISVGTAISAIGNIQSALAQVADVVNSLTGGPAREAAAAEALATAQTPAEFGTAIAAQARSKALKATAGKIWENITPGTTAGETKVGRRVTELIKILRGLDPQAAAVALANVPEEFFQYAPEGYTRADVADAVLAAQRGKGYQAGLSSQGTAAGGAPGNVTNIYPTGTNPTNVEKNMTRYQKINGKPRT